MRKLIFIFITISFSLVLISGCNSNSQSESSRLEIEELRNEINTMQKELDDAMQFIAELSLILETQESIINDTQQALSPNVTDGNDDLLFMSPSEFEDIYVILMYHSDMIDGRLSKAEAMKLRAMWMVNRNLYTGIMQRVAYYAMFGELAYIDKFRHRNEITLKQVQDRILEILSRYDNDMTLEELNRNIIIAQEIYDRLGIFD